MRRSKKPHKQVAAFTLIEIMVSVALLGIVLATVGPSLRRAPASTHGTALALAAAFTEARQQAIAQQVPVALVIPSGSEGQSDSYYIVSGDQPRLNRIQRLGGEQPDVRLLVGHWSLDSSQLDDPALTTTVSPPPGAALNGDFDLDSWGLPHPNDFAFVFTPRGKLVTNDLPRFDGAYHVVVSHGGRCNPAAASGTGVMSTPPTLYAITQVGSAYTVNLDPNGLISVTPGLTAADSGVQQVDKADIGSVPNPPAIDPPPTADPVVTSVKLSPDPTKLNLPPGVNMLLAPDRHMTMTVRAESPERVPLFCQWTSGGVGGLSSSEPVRMTYLPAEGEWEGVWQWRAPAGAAAGDQFTLEGVVSDTYGHQVPAPFGAATDLVVAVGDSSAQICFQSNRDGEYDIYLMNLDGTGLTNLTNDTASGVPEYEACLSPDRDRLTFFSMRDGTPEVYLSNADGSGQTNLTSMPGNDGEATWSPLAGQIAFTSSRSGTADVYVMNGDGSPPVTNVTDNTLIPYPDNHSMWSPDATQIVYEHGENLGVEIMVTNSDGSTVAPLNLSNSPGFYDRLPSWSPDGTRVAFISNRDGMPNLFVTAADGSGVPLKLSTALVTGSEKPSWSPDSSKLVFISEDGDSEVFVVNADGLSPATNLTNNSTWDGNNALFTASGEIVFVSNRDGNEELYLMNDLGLNPRNLTHDPGADRMPNL